MCLLFRGSHPLQSVLLDEVSGLRKNIDAPVVVGGVTQGTAQVASWNVKRVLNLLFVV